MPSVGQVRDHADAAGGNEHLDRPLLLPDDARDVAGAGRAAIELLDIRDSVVFDVDVLDAADGVDADLAMPEPLLTVQVFRGGGGTPVFAPDPNSVGFSATSNVCRTASAADSERRRAAAW